MYSHVGQFALLHQPCKSPTESCSNTTDKTRNNAVGDSIGLDLIK